MSFPGLPRLAGRGTVVGSSAGARRALRIHVCRDQRGRGGGIHRLCAHYAPLGLGEGTYTRAYTLQQDAVGIALFRVSAWLVRDFAFLLLLLAVAVPRCRGRPAWRRPFLYACVWMSGWLAVYLPWPVTSSISAAICVRSRASPAWSAVTPGPRSRRHPGTGRRVAWAVLVASGSLWLVAIVNAVADARVGCRDRSNADLVDFLAGLPSKSRVILNTGVNEYLLELPMHLPRSSDAPTSWWSTSPGVVPGRRRPTRSW